MIGDKIRNRRIELGLTQQELADLTNFKTKGAISRIENNQRDIDQNQIVNFAKTLKTTPSYLMGWTDSSIKEDDSCLIYKDEDFSLYSSTRKIKTDYHNIIGDQLILMTRPSRDSILRQLDRLQFASLQGSEDYHQYTDEKLLEFYEDLVKAGQIDRE